jgi:GntR family transcriptional regulator, rspAB operon transcriptional repressor
VNSLEDRLLTKPNRAKANKLGEVERVYRILRDWLITAKLPPGEFLSEADLAERCGTSRTPVREACTRLMQDHWLTRIRRKGFMVTPISVRDIVDLYDYRKLLECYSAEKLAQTASHDQIRELAAIVAPEKDPEAALEQILAANQIFHLRLCELAGNQRVMGQLNLTLGYVARLDTLCTQTVPGWIGHAEILRAIERREPAEARHAMQVHVDASRDKMVKLFSA